MPQLKTNKVIRKLEKRYYYQKTFSRLIPRLIRKGYLKESDIIRVIKESIFPNNARDILNIYITLVKDFNKPHGNKTLNRAFRFWDKNKETIKSKMHAYYLENYENIVSKNISENQAQKELIARGFKKNFKKKDMLAGHLQSTIDKYIYPVNFGFCVKTAKYKISVYEAITLVGVMGYTRCLTPKL